MVSILDVFLNFVNSVLVMLFFRNILTVNKKKISSISYLEFLSKKSKINISVFCYLLISVFLILRILFRVFIVENSKRKFLAEIFEFFSFFYLDSKILIQGTKSAISEFFLAILFCRRKFPALSAFMFVLFMVLKIFYVPYIDKIRNFRSSYDDFSGKCHFFLIIILIGLSHIQVLVCKTILLIYRRRTVNSIIGTEIVYLTSLTRMVIITHTFLLINHNVFDKKWLMEEKCEFYQKFISSVVGIFIYKAMLNNISISKKVIFRYYALRKILGCIKEFVLDFEEFTRFRKTTISINKLMKSPTDKDINTLTDKTCIICRDEMKSEFSKMLSCGHIFHIKCLQNWLRRQYCCPICLSSISSNISNQNIKKEDCLMLSLRKEKLNILSASMGFVCNSVINKRKNFNMKNIKPMPQLNPDVVCVCFSSFFGQNEQINSFLLIKKRTICDLAQLFKKLNNTKKKLLKNFWYFYEKNNKKFIEKSCVKFFQVKYGNNWIHNQGLEVHENIKNVLQKT
nr:ERAD-associated E3 ubiquitin-protein ligase [Cryptomonas sp.]